MQPAKKTAWTNPTLNLFPQIKLQSDTVEPPRPPTHSHDSGERPQTPPPPLSSQTEPETHLQSGSRSAKIMTMVWKASRAHARLVRMKCLSCHRPNSPQCFRSMSSMQSFSVGGFFFGGSNGERRLSISSEGNVVAAIVNISVSNSAALWGVLYVLFGVVRYILLLLLLLLFLCWH